jgi:hypothetical protein
VSHASRIIQSEQELGLSSMAQSPQPGAVSDEIDCVYREGFEAGFNAGREAGFEKGFDRGFQAGRKAAEQGPTAASDKASSPGPIEKDVSHPRRLLGLPCDKCGAWFYSDEALCPRCKSPKVTTKENPAQENN